MKAIIDPITGHLLLEADTEERSALADDDGGTLIYEMVRALWVPLPGKDYGAALELDTADNLGLLSSAPVIGDIIMEDDGTLVCRGPLWHYNDYQIRNWTRDLIENGRVVFDRVPEETA